MVNSDKLKGRMREKRVTQKDVAEALGIAQPTANQKINNLRAFSLVEAEKLARLLDIESVSFGEYFFG